MLESPWGSREVHKRDTHSEADRLKKMRKSGRLCKLAPFGPSYWRYRTEGPLSVSALEVNHRTD